MKQAEHLSVYKHNFASWTASRAVQRDFTSTPIIRAAIDYSGLNKAVITLATKKLSIGMYDDWHIEIVSKLRKSLIKSLEKEKLSYGRLSKIIAIYLKTFHILNNPYDKLSQIAHIPVDRIILDELYKNYKISIFNTTNTTWTKLSQKKYFSVIAELRNVQKVENLKCLWMLEKYWVIK